MVEALRRRVCHAVPVPPDEVHGVMIPPCRSLHLKRRRTRHRRSRKIFHKNGIFLLLILELKVGILGGRHVRPAIRPWARHVPEVPRSVETYWAIAPRIVSNLDRRVSRRRMTWAVHQKMVWTRAVSVEVVQETVRVVEEQLNRATGITNVLEDLCGFRQRERPMPVTNALDLLGVVLEGAFAVTPPVAMEVVPVAFAHGLHVGLMVEFLPGTMRPEGAHDSHEGAEVVGPPLLVVVGPVEMPRAAVVQRGVKTLTAEHEDAVAPQYLTNPCCVEIVILAEAPYGGRTPENHGSAGEARQKPAKIG